MQELALMQRVAYTQFVPVTPRASQDPRVYALALGLAVQQLRDKRGLSQQELAEKIGVSQPTLSRLERGLGRPDALILRRLAEALGVTVDHLNMQVDAALAKAEKAARQTVPRIAQTPETPWWEGAIGIAGFLGLAGLIGFAVAAALSEDERPKEPASKPATRSPATRHRAGVGPG